ncbi:CHAT domain-containing protein [Variovorax saccharolyticus]|uniref:CHAT domain-containing protein n=1 Tax=Variovorax saccharolyticus TaxID=3053516 RepID=UPI002574CA67|nr:CHAT domain-containing protein [Variovorax sp. J31P216]MDM0029869.1 CHAT domain-containing protein [Variovorax sp. J31P216]
MSTPDPSIVTTLRDVPCGRCMLPLSDAPLHIHALVRDNDEPDLVARAQDGTINRIVCPHCHLAGWITRPFLYVDRVKARAVFITGGTWRHDAAEQELQRLLQKALCDVAPEAAALIRDRLQKAEHYHQLPEMLARGAEEAALERLALEAFRLREGLPPKARLEQLLKDAAATGGLVLEGYEQSAEFAELVRKEAHALAPGDDSRRAQGLTQLHAALSSARRADHDTPARAPLASFPTEEAPSLELFSSLLDLEEQRAIDVEIDGLLAAKVTLPHGSRRQRVLARIHERMNARREEADAASIDPLRQLAQQLADPPDAAAKASRGMDQAKPEIDLLLAAAVDSQLANNDRLGALCKASGLLLNQGMNREAAVIAQRAIDLATTLGNEVSLTEGLAQAGIALARLHDAHQALQYLEAAYQRLQAELDYEQATLLAHVLESIGSAQMALSDLPMACRAFESAADMFERLGRLDGAAGNLLALGDACALLGDLPIALTSHRSALSKASPESPLAVRCLMAMAGILAMRAGPPDIAMELAFVPGSQAPPFGLGGSTLDATTQLALLHDEQLALGGNRLPPDLERQRIVFRSLESMDDGRKVLRSEVLIGDEAVRSLLEARRIAQAHGHHALEVDALMRLANTFTSYGMPHAARSALELGLQRQEQTGQRSSEVSLSVLAQLWESIARSAYQSGQVEEANECWQASLRSCAQWRQRGSSELDRTGEIEGFRAVSLEALGQHRDAAEAYRAAIGAFEGLRGHLSNRGHKLHVQATSLSDYARAARNLLALHAQCEPGPERDALAAEAFRHNEASRSRLLLDMLGTHREAHEGRAPQVRPVALNDLAQRLPAGTALIEYALLPTYGPCQGCWTIYAVTRETGAVPLVARAGLEEVYEARNALVSEMNRVESTLIESHARGQLDAARFDSLLRDTSRADELLERLGALLLPSAVWEALQAKGITRIVFSPEAYLVDIPFAALRVRSGGAIDYLVGSTSQLGVETIVAASASAYATGAGRSRKAISQSSLLCISDPSLDLIGAQQWVQATVAHDWPGAQALHLAGADATLQGMLEALPASDAVFYFGHGSFDPDNPMQSGLLLHDQAFTAQALRDEATRQRFARCGLFVMLACSGARLDSQGQWKERELQGLSTGLLECGVASVVGALWPLWDSLARDFGERLFRAYGAGMSMSAACRKALSGILQTGGAHAHPYLWAAILLSGSAASHE